MPIQPLRSERRRPALTEWLRRLRLASLREPRAPWWAWAPLRCIRLLAMLMLVRLRTRTLAILTAKRPRLGLPTQRSPGRTISAAPTP